MKRILLIPVLMLLAGADAKDDLAKTHLKKLQGDWVMVSGSVDGAKLDGEHVKKCKITWKDSDAVVETPHQSKEPIKAKIGTIDASKTPAEMDWIRVNGPDAGKKMLAIYEFIGDDKYRICFAPAGKNRPKDFEAKAGSGHFTHVWERAK